MNAYQWQNFFLSPLESGLCFALLALGVFIAFRVLDIADLSVEGIFPFIAVLTGYLIAKGWNPWLVILLATALGAALGALNAALSIYGRIPPLLSGIIVMSIGFALALMVVSLNKGAISFDPAETPSIFTPVIALFSGWGLTSSLSISLANILILGLFLAVIGFALYFFFGTELGTAIRAAGKNKQMSRANGINVEAMVLIGLALSGALAALSACLYTQIQHAATAQDGSGKIVLGLSILFLGEAIFPHAHFKSHLFAVIAGSFVYWYLIQILIQFLGGTGYVLYLYKALILILVLALPPLISRLKGKRKKQPKGGIQNA